MIVNTSTTKIKEEIDSFYLQHHIMQDKIYDDHLEHFDKKALVTAPMNPNDESEYNQMMKVQRAIKIGDRKI